MEPIEITLRYRSGAKNGWPLITVYCNNQWIDCFEADGDQMTFCYHANPGPISVTIEHWGKNPITDSGQDDKFFELTDLTINHVPCGKLLGSITKKIKPTPWDKTPSISNDTYLGHNGMLELKIASPIKDWLRGCLNPSLPQIQGQETSREVLEQAKRFFKIHIDNS